MVMYSQDHIRITPNILRDIPPQIHIERHTSQTLLPLVIAQDHLRQFTHIWVGALLFYHMEERADIPDHL